MKTMKKFARPFLRSFDGTLRQGIYTFPERIEAAAKAVTEAGGPRFEVSFLTGRSKLDLPNKPDAITLRAGENSITVVAQFGSDCNEESLVKLGFRALENMKLQGKV
jgi:hypothetical protein